jgi:hypothetical protein
MRVHLLRGPEALVASSIKAGEALCVPFKIHVEHAIYFSRKTPSLEIQISFPSQQKKQV